MHGATPAVCSSRICPRHREPWVGGNKWFTSLFCSRRSSAAFNWQCRTARTKAVKLFSSTASTWISVLLSNHVKAFILPSAAATPKGVSLQPLQLRSKILRRSSMAFKRSKRTALSAKPQVCPCSFRKPAHNEVMFSKALPSSRSMASSMHFCVDMITETS